MKDLEPMETTYKKRSSDLKIRESLKSSHMDMNSIKSSSDTDVIKTYESFKWVNDRNGAKEWRK